MLVNVMFHVRLVFFSSTVTFAREIFFCHRDFFFATEIFFLPQRSCINLNSNSSSCTPWFSYHHWQCKQLFGCQYVFNLLLNRDKTPCLLPVLGTRSWICALVIRTIAVHITTTTSDRRPTVFSRTLPDSIRQRLATLSTGFRYTGHCLGTAQSQRIWIIATDVPTRCLGIFTTPLTRLRRTSSAATAIKLFGNVSTATSAAILRLKMRIAARSEPNAKHLSEEDHSRLGFPWKQEAGRLHLHLSTVRLSPRRPAERQSCQLMPGPSLLLWHHHSYTDWYITNCTPSTGQEYTHFTGHTGLVQWLTDLHMHLSSY